MKTEKKIQAPSATAKDNAPQGFCTNSGSEQKHQPSGKTDELRCEDCRGPVKRKPRTKNKQGPYYRFTCAHCGKPFTAYGNSKRKYCSHSCYILDRFPLD